MGKDKVIEFVIVCFGVGALIFAAIGFGQFCYRDPNGGYIFGAAVVIVLVFVSWNHSGSAYGGRVKDDPPNPWDPDDSRNG